jgi:hypothetical protein
MTTLKAALVVAVLGQVDGTRLATPRSQTVVEAKYTTKAAGTTHR